MATATMSLTPAETVAALRALRAHPAYAHNADADYAVRYAEHTGLAPAWLTALADAPNRWYVRHGAYTYETTAASEADAVNKVRYRLYGATAEADLPPFYAVNPALIVADAAAAVRRPGAPVPAAPVTNGASATANTQATRRDANAATRKPAISKANALLRLRKMAAA